MLGSSDETDFEPRMCRLVSARSEDPFQALDKTDKLRTELIEGSLRKVLQLMV